MGDGHMRDVVSRMLACQMRSVHTPFSECAPRLSSPAWMAQGPDGGDRLPQLPLQSTMGWSMATSQTDSPLSCSALAGG